MLDKAEAAVSECPICNRTLGPNTSVQRHIKAVHLKIKNHECSVCEKKFFRKNDRDKHMVRHILTAKRKLKLPPRINTQREQPDPDIN